MECQAERDEQQRRGALAFDKPVMQRCQRENGSGEASAAAPPRRSLAIAVFRCPAGCLEDGSLETPDARPRRRSV